MQTPSAVQPMLLADPMVEEAAARAFRDLAAAWYSIPAEAPAPARLEKRRAQLQSVIGLGFADLFETPAAREPWPDAAAIIRAQAGAAAPIDMALLIAAGDRDASIAFDPFEYHAGTHRKTPDDPLRAAALALGRALQISAALRSALELSLQYAQDRRQFGQALARFQTIQHGLALVAEEVAASTVIADLALACAARDGLDSARMPSLLDAAALVCSQGVDVAYDICHQVHGAIGVTREYALHRHTLNLQRWRDELVSLRGGELRSAERLGQSTGAAGGAWRTVVALMTPGEPHE